MGQRSVTCTYVYRRETRRSDGLMMPQGDDEHEGRSEAHTHPSRTSRVRNASMAAGGHCDCDGCGEVLEVTTPSSSGICSMSSMSTSDSSMRSKMSGVRRSAVALRSCARLRRIDTAHADARTVQSQFRTVHVTSSQPPS